MDFIKKILISSCLFLSAYETEMETNLISFINFPEGYKKIESIENYSLNSKFNKPFLREYSSIERKISSAYFHLVEKHNLPFGENAIIILGKEQKLYLVKKNKNPKNLEESLWWYNDLTILSEHEISTGRGGFGNIIRKAKTPIGSFKIIEKIGEDLEIGTVIGRPEEIDSILTTYSDTNKNSPGLLISRLIRLGGLDENNNEAFSKVGIHGTNQEQKIGKWASGGCIRLRNKEVIEFYKKINLGTLGEVVSE